MLSSANFRSRSRRSAFVADVEATPPPPNLEPARFCDVLAWTFDGVDEETYLVIHGDRLSKRACIRCIIGDKRVTQKYETESKLI
jgi:hypothetical protein